MIGRRARASEEALYCGLLQCVCGKWGEGAGEVWMVERIQAGTCEIAFCVYLTALFTEMCVDEVEDFHDETAIDLSISVMTARNRACLK